MGRRAVSTTKTGRFMNPTDRCRKEARKKELRKNKKQRLLVRTNVLKSREPTEILTELEQYDQMECSMNAEGSTAEPKLSDRVIQEKRKKLLETFDRIVNLYKREEPEQVMQLVQQRQEYEQKRHHMLLRYEQIKAAERVDASDIPLPSLPPSAPGSLISRPGFPTVTLPGEFRPGILKRAPIMPKPNREPPGPPPGPPPDLSDEEDATVTGKPRIRFANDQPAPPGEEPVKISNKLSSMVNPQPRVAAPVAAVAAALRPPAMQPFPLRPPAAGTAPSQPRPNQPITNKPAAVATTTTSNSKSDSSNQHQPTAPTLKKGQTSISARPQLKNLIGDATKLVPVALRVKRNAAGDVTGKSMSKPSSVHTGLVGASSKPAIPQQPQQNKEDAYSQFMNEMQGLI